MNLNITRQKLKTLLKDNTFTRYSISKKWLLNSNRVFSYKTSQRLFKKKQIESWQKYNIDILIDFSWSMVWRDLRMATSITKDIIKLFDWIVTFRIVWFNIQEVIIPKNKFLHTDFNEYSYEELWDNDLEIKDIDWKKVFVKSIWWSVASCQWNREIINIQNSFEYLQKQQWKNFIIIIWDWVMNVDSFEQEFLINWNYYISWKPVKKYNKQTTEETIKHIEKNWVKVLWLNTRWAYPYLDNSFKVNWTEDSYKHILNFLNKNIK